HASFRVQLGASSRRQSPSIARHLSATEVPAGAPARRRPVVWSGHSAPDDTGAHRLLQAVRAGSVGHAAEPAAADAGATQVIPGVEVEDLAERTMEPPLVGAQRTRDNRLLPHMRAVDSVYDEPAYAPPGYEEYEPPRERAPGDPARHAYYPGRRLNL